MRIRYYHILPTQEFAALLITSVLSIYSVSGFSPNEWLDNTYSQRILAQIDGFCAMQTVFAAPRFTLRIEVSELITSIKDNSPRANLHAEKTGTREMRKRLDHGKARLRLEFHVEDC